MAPRSSHASLALFVALGCTPSTQPPVVSAPTPSVAPATPVPEPEPEPEPAHFQATQTPEAHPVLWSYESTHSVIRTILAATDPDQQRAWVQHIPPHQPTSGELIEIDLRTGTAKTIIGPGLELFAKRRDLVQLGELAAAVGHPIASVQPSPDGAWLFYDQGQAADHRGQARPSPFAEGAILELAFASDPDHYAYHVADEAEMWTLADWERSTMIVQRGEKRQELPYFGPIRDIIWSPSLASFFVYTSLFTSPTHMPHRACVHRVSADGREREQLVCIEQDEGMTSSVGLKFAPAGRLALIGTTLEDSRNYTWFDLERGKIHDELELRHGGYTHCLFDDGVAVIRIRPPLDLADESTGIAAIQPGQRTSRILPGYYSTTCERASDGSLVVLRDDVEMKPRPPPNLPGAKQDAPMLVPVDTGDVSLVRVDLAALLRE